MPLTGKFNPPMTQTVSDIKDAGLQKEIDAINQQLQATSANKAQAGGPPVLCSGSGIRGSNGFYIGAIQQEDGELPQFCLVMPQNVTRVFIVLGKVSDATSKSITVHHWVQVPDDITTNGGHWEFQYPHPLKYNTLYGLIRIIAQTLDVTGDTISEIKNPQQNPFQGGTYAGHYLDQFTTGPPVGAPGPPNCATDIIENIPAFDHHTVQGHCVFRIWADPSHQKTFRQQSDIKAWALLQRDDGANANGVPHAPAGKTKRVGGGIDPVDLDSVSLQLAGTLPVGTWWWTGNLTGHGTGHTNSGGPACSFVAGGFSTLLSDLNQIAAGTTISFVTIDPHHLQISFTFTQPANPIDIKKIQILMGDAVGGPFWIEFGEHLVSDGATFDVTGPHTITATVKTKVAHTHFVKIRFFGIPGLVADSTVFNSTTGADVTGDASAANWIFGLNSADPTLNVGLRVIINSKNLKLHWTPPQHLTVAPDAIPQSLLQYGMQMVDGTGTTWINLDTAPPYATVVGGSLQAPGYEHILTANVNKFLHGWLKPELPAAFLNNGFKVALRPYNVVNNVLTPGPWCNYTGTFTVSGDPVADATVPGQPPAPAITQLIEGVRVDAVLPTTGANAITKWQIAMSSFGFAPTDSDPPTEGGDPVFVFVENATGTKKFRIPGLDSTITRFFWTRCKNASNPTSGGPGGQGWSPWSPSASINGSLSIITALTPGPPVLVTTAQLINAGDTNAVPGYATIGSLNNSSPIPGDLEPAHIWLDNSNPNNVLVVVEVVLPTDPNAWSLTAILFEVYRASNQVLRVKTAISPALTNVFTFLAFAGFAAVRYRLQNQFRDNSGTDAGSGLSPFTNYMQGQGATAPLTYNPANNPPPANDFHSIPSRPNPFISPL